MSMNYHDLSLFYEVYGTGKETVVILPGWGETKNTFQEIIRILSIDYTVYIVDYPGFGNSPFPHRDLTMEDYTELIIAFLTDQQIKQPNIIAHSFGGRIAILLTSKYAIRINKLILMDSAGIKPRMTLKKLLRRKTYHLLQSLSNLLPKKWRQKAKHKLFTTFSSSDYQNLTSAMRPTFQNIINFDLTYYLPHIATETLLLWGANDRDTPLKDGLKMQKKIANSELIIFPRSGHFCYLENPYVIIRIILQFLEG